MDKHEHIRLLGRINHFGFNPSIFFQSGLMSMKLAAMKKVERYAIVGAPGWIAKAASAVGHLFPDMEIKTFTNDHEAEAWDWLDAKPA